MLHTNIPANLAAAVKRMSDRELLFLMDWLSDQLSDESLTDELAEGLACAFERAEEGFSGAFTPIYPARAVSPSVWQDWRVRRDSVLSGKGVL